MKNFLPILIAVSFFWLPSAKSQVTFIGENTTACEGSTVSVDVTVNNFTDIVSAQFGVTWDTAIVEFSSVTDNMPPTALYNTSNAINGELRFSWFDFMPPIGENLPNGYVIFTITFNVMGNYGDVSPVDFGSLPGFPMEVANSGGIIPNGNLVIIPGSVSIEDNVDPVISGCPANISVNVPHGQSSSSVSWAAPTATDNCGTPTLTSTHNSGDVFPVGTTTVTYTATDGNGNTDVCMFDVTVIEDPLPPSALAFIANDVTVNCPSTQVDIPMSVVNFNDITSFQFGLAWDETILQYDSVTNNLPPAALYNDLNASMGELRVSWFDFTPPIGMTLTPPDTVIFILHFTLLTPNVLSTDVTFTSFPLFPIEVANTGGILNNADIVFESSTVTNVDITPPVISGCPANINVNNNPGDCSAVVTWAAPTATDNCSTVTLISTHNSGETFPVGTTTVTYTATDFAGNSAVCSFDITVTDNEDPVINNCPTDISVNNDPDSCNAVVTWTLPTATDNCPGVVLTSAHNSGDIFDVGTTTVTYTATDAAGNSVTCSFNVTVTDTQDPVINNCPTDITVGNDPDSCNAVVTWPAPTATDNCPGVVLTSTHNSGDIFSVGTTTVTYTATDAAGNSVTCSFDVTVNDTEPPVTLCQDITIQLDNTGNTSITAGQIDNGSSDNCGISGMTVTPNTFDCSNVGPNTVTLTVTDVNSNTGTCTATVTVEDNIPPDAVCQDITIQLDNSGGVAITGAQIDNGSTDACGIATLDASPNAFDCSNVGPNTVTLTVTDVNSNTGTCTATVTVEDVTPPVALCQDITVQLDNSGGVAITGAQIDNGSTDACGIATLDASPNAFDCSNVGGNTVTLTVTDVNSNTGTCTATITVEDNIAPTALCQDITVQLDNAGNASITAGQIDNGSSDNCGISSMTVAPNAFTCSDVGSNTVTFTVTDINSNTSTCTATVTVEDVTPPVALCQDITVQLDNAGSASITGAQINNGSTDACGIATLDASPNAFACANVGSNTVTLTVADVNSNASTCTATVIVEDNIAPTALCQDITVQLDADGMATIAEDAVDDGSSDACGPLTFDTDITAFDCTDAGANTVTLTVSDANGNSSSCSATVTIEDDLPPSITCPVDTVYASVNCEALLSDYTGLAVVSDNCTDTVNINVTQGLASSTSISGDTNVTLYAEDEAGNVDSCTFTVIFLDTIPPSIDCPVDTVYAGANCEALLSDYTGLAVVSDNCTDTVNINVTQSLASGTSISGDTNVTLYAEDEAGNIDSCTFTVIFLDTIPPAIDCPVDTVYAGANCEALLSDYTGLAVVSDNCTDTVNINVTQSLASGMSISGNTDVTLYAEDEAGNIDSCTFTVIFLDTIPPTLTCPGNLTIMVPPGTIDTVITNIALVSTGDNCGVDTTYFHLSGDTSGEGPDDASGTAFNVGTTTVSYYVEDAAGNVDSCLFNVTVEETGLTLICPSNVLTVNDTDLCSAVVNSLSLTVTPIDSVQQVFYQMTGATPGFGQNDVSGTAFNVGVTTVTYSAVSNAGDIFTCDFTVQVNDTQPPAFLDCPMVNTTVGNSPNMCGIKFAGDVLPLATDNCPNLTVDYSPTAGTVIPLGTTTITAIATDSSGNSATCSFDLIVVDDEAPQIFDCPTDITMDNEQDDCSAIVQWIEPTATDNCQLIAFTPSQGPNTSFNVGVTPVEYVAVDDAGNVSKCNFNVTVLDSQAPSLSGCIGNTTLNNDAGECGAIVNWPVPTATDNCGVVSLASNLSPPASLSIGSHTVTYTATDPAGNMTSCSFVVTVVDNEFPVISGMPADMTLEATAGLCGTNVTWAAPSATDNCGINSFTSTASSGAFFAAGTTTEVEYVAVDVNGNVTLESFFITIEDNVPPVFTCPGDVIVIVDGNIANDPSGVLTSTVPIDCENIMLNYGGVVATDDCGIASLVQTQGLASGSTFGLGSNIITYLATDNNGNQATCSFTITVGALPAAVADAFPLSPCEGEDVFFSVNQYTGASYTWKDGNGLVVGNAASFILSGLTAAQAGVYTVDISLPFNCQMQSSVEVAVSPNPQVEASSNDLLCQGGLANLNLTATDMASAGVTDWIWEYPDGTFALGQNQTIPNATVDDSGTYTVTGVTANGCSSTATVEVVISNAPTMPTLFGTDAASCVNEPVTLNGQTFFGSSVSYHWYAVPSAGSGLTPINNHIVQVNPTLAGNYVYHFYTVVDGCTSDEAEWALNVQAPPALNVSVDGQTACVNGSSSITLMETGGEATSWTWTNSNGDVLSNTSTVTINNVTAANSGVYKVTASTTNGCVSVATLPVTITNQPPAATLIASASELCTGDAVTLTTTPDYGTNATFVWTGSNLPPFAPDVQSLSVAPDVTGNVTYGFAAVVDGCTTDTVEVTVYVEDTPPVNISVEGETACLDGSTPVTLVPNSPGAVSWVWTNTGGGVLTTDENLMFNPATSANSGTYTVTVQSSIGCEGSGSYALSITDALPEITAVLEDVPCEGSTLYLNTDLIPGATYQWTGPTGSLIAEIRNPVIPNISSVLDGDYTVTATKDGCTSTSQPLPVKIITDPVVNTDDVDVIFETPKTFSVVANDVLEADYDINIIQQPMHGSISYLGNGEYKYTPDAKFRETDRFIYEICYKDCPDACDFAIVTLVVRHDVKDCVITTVITPNDDGINDELIVSCLEVGDFPDNKLLIFNQWGDKVYEAAPYENNWRGTYEGKDLPDGTYFYIFQRDASSPAEKGFVMIYR